MMKEEKKENEKERKKKGRKRIEIEEKRFLIPNV
jgi:hypothetical protein